MQRCSDSSYYIVYCAGVYVCIVSKMELGTQEPLFEQHAVPNKLSPFHSNLMSLNFRVACSSTCMECFPDLVMGTAGSIKCRGCFHDKRKSCIPHPTT